MNINRLLAFRKDYKYNTLLMMLLQLKTEK